MAQLTVSISQGEQVFSIVSRSCRYYGRCIAEYGHLVHLMCHLSVWKDLWLRCRNSSRIRPIGLLTALCARAAADALLDLCDLHPSCWLQLD